MELKKLLLLSVFLMLQSATAQTTNTSTASNTSGISTNNTALINCEVETLKKEVNSKIQKSIDIPLDNK